MHYNPKIVLAFWRDCGLPAAKTEFQFCAGRKWRFDFAFEVGRVSPLPAERDSEKPGAPGVTRPTLLAIEVQGGIFGKGKACPTCRQRRALGHNRGAALVKEHEKRNAAAALGWRVLYCTPQEIQTLAFARTVKLALNFDAN